MVHSKDHKGTDVAHKIQIPASIFPDDDGTVLVRTKQTLNRIFY